MGTLVPKTGFSVEVHLLLKWVKIGIQIAQEVDDARPAGRVSAWQPSIKAHDHTSA